MVNSGRQIGGVFGTALLVLILGNAAVTGDPTQYYHLWWVAAATCAAAAVTSLGLTPRHQTEGKKGLSLSPGDSPRAVEGTVAGRPGESGWPRTAAGPPTPTA